MIPAPAAAGKNSRIAAGVPREPGAHGFVKILITCGPASEAIDSVRRVTNHSTGALGADLATALATSGHEVLCLRGTGATAPPPEPPVAVKPFFGNSELEILLAGEAGNHDVVLHLAALADFLPSQVETESGAFPASKAGKIRSDSKEMVVRFLRAPKLISNLRTWFPRAHIIGWKYEVEGDEPGILLLGKRQIEQNRLDATVLNGPAVGERMIYLPADGASQTFPGRPEFVRAFAAHPIFHNHR
jgi:phosphopantothenate---cysteine ligase (CTP)